MIEWAVGLIQSGGAFAIFVLMVLENIFPPIPSEIIMSLAGFTAARGDIGIVEALFAGISGSVVGATFWYFVGKWIGIERLVRLSKNYGRWLALSSSDILKSKTWFDRYGHWAVLIGRMIPGLRTLISVPAGISKMFLPLFLFFSTLGTIGWISALFAAGYFLENNYHMVDAWMGPVSNFLIGMIVISYIYRVFTFKG